MLNPDKSLDRIKSLMHVIESGNKALINRMDKMDKTYQSPKERLFASPDQLRYKSINPNKIKSVSSSNFFNFHKIRPESTKNSNEIRVLTTWTEAPKTTNTGAETTDRRISQESSRGLINYVTPNKEFERTWGNLKYENSALKKKLEETSLENRKISKENDILREKVKELNERMMITKENEKELEEAHIKLKDLYGNLEQKHNERKKHMKQLIEIISEKEKQLEKAKNLHFEIINKKFKEDDINETLEINHQKIIEYALFLENQLEASEEKITGLMKEHEDFKENTRREIEGLKENREENEMNTMIGNINNELKVIFESLKGIESQKLVNENQYNNEFQNLEESEKKVIKRSIEDLEEQKQKLFKYLRGFFHYFHFFFIFFIFGVFFGFFHIFLVFLVFFIFFCFFWFFS